MSTPCTFKSCSRTFKTEKLMIAHKINDPHHSYCKCCDEDFEDDMGLFIHQLGSSNHIVCPVDALEFKSSAARDIHFEQSHPQKQTINCAGCEKAFNSASSLMRHIEKDECSVIRLTDYHLQRAERHLEKEAWESDANHFGVLQVVPRPNTGPSSEPAITAFESFPKPSLTLPLGGPIPSALSQKFPTLPSASRRQPAPQPMSSTAWQSPIHQSNTDLLELTEPEALLDRLNISDRSWSKDILHQRKNEPQPPVTDDKVQYWLNGHSDSFGPADDPPSSPRPEPSALVDDMSFNTQKENHVPSSVWSPTSTQDARYNRIQLRSTTNQSAISSPSVDAERFWDPQRQEYICTAHRCHGQGFKTQQDFQEHKLSSIHIGGQIVCPSCLKSFHSQAGFLAHAASRNRKCRLKESVHFNAVVREQTAGMIGTEGFMEDGVTPRFTTQEIQDW